VEGTLGAVEPAAFREAAGETALQGQRRESAANLVSWFARDRFRAVAGRGNLPSIVRH
jgi:ribosomal protein S14